MPASAADISLPVEPESVATLARWLEARADGLGLAGTTREALRLCAEEAATNIVRHAYPDGVRQARFLARIESNGEVTLAFDDDGIPFDPTRYVDDAQAGEIEDARIGGVGIRLIRGFASGIRYERVGTINRLVLAFERPAA
ncbi:MAG: ATP-binding protein [Alphaproteobacteria bacterium]